ncbi:MAG: helix-turn-helix domain-containing protein [Brockia lithotrophica]|nr:helix-turn-helix domain-containing protein [Brockia lithotrophica]
MPELGEVIRRAREEKGMGLDELAAITKIQRRYLEALEAGQYTRLPGPFYTRAFVRSVAEVLDLDADELLARYESELPRQPYTDDAYVLKLGEAQPRRKSRDVFGPWLARGVLLLFLALVGYIFYHFVLESGSWWPRSSTSSAWPSAPKVRDNLPPGPITETAPDTGNAGAAPAPDKEEPPPAPEKTELLFVREEGKTSLYEVRGTDALTLSLSAPGGDVWVRVQKDGEGGEVLFERTLRKGEQVDVDTKGAKSLWIRLGATANARIEVSGAELVLKDKPNVYNVWLQLGSSGSKASS